jgi:hypothetical protein
VLAESITDHISQKLNPGNQDLPRVSLPIGPKPPVMAGCVTKPHGKTTVNKFGTRIGRGVGISQRPEPAQKKVRWNLSPGVLCGVVGVKNGNL